MPDKFSSKSDGIQSVTDPDDVDSFVPAEVCIEVDKVEDIKHALEEIELSPETPEILKVQAEKARNAILVAMHQSSFSGPMPPPDVLQQFDRVVPGLADRIATMAEEEGKHRRAMEKIDLEGELKLKNRDCDERRLGQWFAFLIGVTAIVSGTVTAIMGSPVAGTFIGGSGVVGLVGAFLYSRTGKNTDSSQSGKPSAEDEEPASEEP